MHAADDEAVRLLKSKAAVKARMERLQAAQQQHAPAWRLSALREAQQFGCQAVTDEDEARAVRFGRPVVSPRPATQTLLSAALHSTQYYTRWYL